MLAARAVDPGARAAVARSVRRSWHSSPSSALLRAQPVERSRGNRRARIARSTPRVRRRGGTAPLRRAPPKEAQSIHQQGLTGAGFAGNHGQARTELQFGSRQPWRNRAGRGGEHGAHVPVPWAQRGICLCRIGGFLAALGTTRSAWPAPAAVYPGMARPRRSARAAIAAHAGVAAHPRRRAGRLADLARHAGLDVSPATIRNILPTSRMRGCWPRRTPSAGRVPTAQGYRVFVDSLLQLKPLGEGELSTCGRNCRPARHQVLLGSASNFSAWLRRRGRRAAARAVRVPQIEFVPLDPQRVLASWCWPTTRSEPDDRDAPRVRPGRTRTRRTTSTRISPGSRCSADPRALLRDRARPATRCRRCWPLAGTGRPGVRAGRRRHAGGGPDPG